MTSLTGSALASRAARAGRAARAAIVGVGREVRASAGAIGVRRVAHASPADAREVAPAGCPAESAVALAAHEVNTRGTCAHASESGATRTGAIGRRRKALNDAAPL